jgi:hypothetical protein
MVIGYKITSKGYEFAPYIPIKEFCFRIPNLEFIGYDTNGKAKFKKTKPKQR